MTELPTMILKNRPVPPVSDFYELRRQAIGFIEELSGTKWTDYNVHDPGITILEAAIYAITDISYRMTWDIADILAPAVASPNAANPFPDQSFFSARQIFTVNPVTPDDLRRLLADIPGVRNAWVTCKHCACETSWTAVCDASGFLRLGFGTPEEEESEYSTAHARGLYDVTLALESDDDLGDLNDRKITHHFSYSDAAATQPVIMELRFPELSMADKVRWDAFLGDANAPDTLPMEVEVLAFGEAKGYDLFSELATAPERNAYLRRHWRDLLFVSLRLKAPDNTVVIDIPNVTLRIIGGNTAKNIATADDLKDVLQDKSAMSVVQRFRRKARRARTILTAAKAVLQSHRNLDEDFCYVGGIGVEELAVCADVEVAATADIEQVQARIWDEVSRYLDPPLIFNSLEELRAQGIAVEDIFNGMELQHGFITDANLAAADLRSDVRVSDIINILMDIPGVVAVNQMLLTKYDSTGDIAKGAADPSWINGELNFDVNRSSASWQMFISPGHQSRLSRSNSRFLFYKNGLPFTPRMSEAESAFNILSGSASGTKVRHLPDDLPVPAGTYRNPESYYPLQYSLPAAYGVSKAGLPSNASKNRLSQANNLRAYLLTFEQLTGNCLAQFAHAADLFALDPRIDRSYFFKTFAPSDISNLSRITKPSLNAQVLGELVESPSTFSQRRNQFLDHILARFGEGFDDYALLTTDADGSLIGQDQLILNKIVFARNYPSISHDRGKALNYTKWPCAVGNSAALGKRISLLLGHRTFSFAAMATGPVSGNFNTSLTLADDLEMSWLTGQLSQAASAADEAVQAAQRVLLTQMVRPSAFGISLSAGKYRLALKSADGVELAADPVLSLSPAAALERRNALVDWAAQSRMIIVEHLLLRPKFPGDALYPACSASDCCSCGDQDPYSFRLTFVMPGWAPRYADNLDLRRFAERTIKTETPSHLLPKTCWVGNLGLEEYPCDGIVEYLAALLETEGQTQSGAAPGQDEACNCAMELHHAFREVFAAWYQGKTLDVLPQEAWATRLEALFNVSPLSADINCGVVMDATLWPKVKAAMVRYFADVATHGWQFDRFEDIWCKWLKANAAIDWTEERLVERVAAILLRSQRSPVADSQAICQCAEDIVLNHGKAFAIWLDGKLAAGTALEDIGVPPQQLATLCDGMNFKPDTAETISALLNHRYTAYRDVSYWLRRVVALLGQFSSTYPSATLHDCDDGSDLNPVRLGNTALGGTFMTTFLK